MIINYKSVLIYIWILCIAKFMREKFEEKNNFLVINKLVQGSISSKVIHNKRRLCLKQKH